MRSLALGVLALALLALLASAHAQAQTCNKTIATEYPFENEEATLDGLVNFFSNVAIEKKTGLRDAHGKTHACAAATFTVGSNLPSNYKKGVFKTEGASFPAIVRFSNSNGFVRDDDALTQVRGMGVKLFNVPGEKLVYDPLETTTQDFVTVSGQANQFFTIRASDYLALAQNRTAYCQTNPLGSEKEPLRHATHANLCFMLISVSNGRSRPNFVLVAFFFPCPRPPSYRTVPSHRTTRHARRCKLLAEGAAYGTSFFNPLGLQYQSMVPYLHGEGQVRLCLPRARWLASLPAVAVWRVLSFPFLLRLAARRVRWCPFFRREEPGAC